MNPTNININKFNRLVTLDDFDGIVSAVLLSTLNHNLKIEFTGPNEIRKGKVKIDSKTIITDLPYSDKCGLWFDHHISNKGKGFHEVAPSAARVIYNNLHLLHPILFRYEDLVEWCDKIDTADYSKKDILFPKGYVLLAFTLSVTDGYGDEEKYMLHLIKLMKKLMIDEILNDAWVKKRTADVNLNLKKYIKIVREHIQDYDNLFYVVDMRDVDVDAGIKFVAHTLMENKKIGVFLKSSGGKVKFSLSYNYLYRSRFEPVDLSKICKHYDGGGHPRAAGILVEKQNADKVLDQIIQILKKVDWQPK